jgi:protein-tyrosine phosphatase
MSQILENLWLGGLDLIHDFEFLKENKITHVLSILESNVLTPQMVELNIKQKYVKLYDSDEAPIGTHFESCCAFIMEALKSGGAVYVHCFMGISRSPTIVAAYLMQSRRLSVEAALEFIRKERPVIDPNDGFRTALSVWESKLEVA